MGGPARGPPNPPRFPTPLAAGTFPPCIPLAVTAVGGKMSHRGRSLRRLRRDQGAASQHPHPPYTACSRGVWPTVSFQGGRSPQPVLTSLATDQGCSRLRPPTPRTLLAVGGFWLSVSVPQEGGSLLQHPP